MNTKTFLTITLACAVLGALPPAFAAMPKPADKAAPAMNVDRASFLKVVASSNAFEIGSSRLALEKASAADVKTFAGKMVEDHGKAGEELRKAAGSAPPDTLSPKHAAMLKTLEGASGEAFQALYIDMQATAHMEAVTLFATYAAGGDDPALKAFAARTLPVLEMHKAHVLKLVAAH